MEIINHIKENYSYEDILKVIIIIVIVTLLYIYFRFNRKDYKTSISILCIKPSPILVDFLKELDTYHKQNSLQYDIFLVCDDNSETYYIDEHIKVIQLNNDLCKQGGYYSMLDKGFQHKYNTDVSAWDKVMYYLCHNNYDYNWILEDDVFIPLVETIHKINSKYTGDLLTSTNGINTYGDISEWHWSNEMYRADKTVYFEPPWYNSMVCGCRLSSNLIDEIRKFVVKEDTLMHHEILFNTLAMKTGLRVETPIELENIVYRKDYTFDDIDIDYLYHPIKDLTTQKEYRTLLK